MRNLKKWLSQRLSGTEGTAADDADGFRLAVAALMVEVLRADETTAATERRQVVESLGLRVLRSEVARIGSGTSP